MQRHNPPRGTTYVAFFLAAFLPVFFLDFLAPFFAAFLGTLAPFFRASDNPIAMACLRLLTFFPLPLRSCPRFFLCIVLFTFFFAPFEYFAMTLNLSGRVKKSMPRFSHTKNQSNLSCPQTCIYTCIKPVFLKAPCSARNTLRRPDQRATVP